MKSVSVILSAAFILTMVLSINAGAEIYQWVDENGVPHFSNSPKAAQKQQNVHIIKEFESDSPSDAVARRRNYGHAGPDRLDRLISEKEDEMARLKHRHKNELCILESDLGAKQIDLETCTRFPLPEVHYWSESYERDKKRRDRAIRERADAQEAVRKAQLAIQQEKTRYQNAKKQIERDLLQLRIAKSK